MRQYPFDRNLANELDVLNYYSDAIYYRNAHKSESVDIAVHVFDRTHPKGRLSFPISAEVDRLRDEFGALEAPGMPEDDEKDPDEYVDEVWQLLDDRVKEIKNRPRRDRNHV